MNTSSTNLGDIRNVRVELDAIAREHRAMPAGLDRSALLARANVVLQTSQCLRIREFATVATSRIATILNDTERPAEALAVLEQGESELGLLREHPLGVSFRQEQVRAHAILARTDADPESALRRWRTVEDLTSGIIALEEQLRARITVPALFSAYSRYSIRVYALAVEARLILGDHVGALQRTELVKCRSLHRLSGGMASDVDQSALRAEFRSLSEQIDVAVARGEPPSSTVVARRRAVWDVLAIDRFAERTDTFATLDVPAFQTMLPSDTAAVSWFWLDRQRFLVALLTPDTMEVHLQTVEAATRKAIDEQAARILRYESGSDIPTKLEPELTDVLLPLPLQQAMAGRHRLILSPHRSMHALPLHALRWTDGRPLARSFAVSYSPNLTTLARPRRTRTAREVLFVGVPQRAPSLRPAPLHEVHRELASLRDIYGGALLPCCGTDGSESRLRAMNAHAELERFAALHFACHGTSVDSLNPMESKLRLYDSDLDGLDITEWRLDADLVVLSACSAGQRPIDAGGGVGREEDELPGDELFGLQASFFAAGAHQVLASQWPVEDEVATRLCSRFHELWKEHPADVALNRAVCEYMDEEGRIAEARPHSWACFFLTTSRMPADYSHGGNE